MYIVNFIRRFLTKRHVDSIQRILIRKGKNCDFNRSSLVSLQDNSDANDILLGESVWMYGHLLSQNHGK